MNNKKGFTLVELLAVIVVLAIIIGIAIPASISLSNRSKKRMYFSKIDMILESAKMYGQDNQTKYNVDGSCNRTVSVSEMVNDGKIKKDDDDGHVVDPYGGGNMDDYVVCIYKKNNRITASIPCGSSNFDDTWNINGAFTDSDEMLEKYCYD